MVEAVHIKQNNGTTTTKKKHQKVEEALLIALEQSHTIQKLIMGQDDGMGGGKEVKSTP